MGTGESWNSGSSLGLDPFFCPQARNAFRLRSSGVLVAGYGSARMVSWRGVLIPPRMRPYILQCRLLSCFISVCKRHCLPLRGVLDGSGSHSSLGRLPLTSLAFKISIQGTQR